MLSTHHLYCTFILHICTVTKLAGKISSDKLWQDGNKPLENIKPNGMLNLKRGPRRQKAAAARGPDTCQRKKGRRMPAPAFSSSLSGTCGAREASLLLLEEEKEDGWYCFPLGQKASSDTNRRDVL